MLERYERALGILPRNLPLREQEEHHIIIDDGQELNIINDNNGNIIIANDGEQNVVNPNDDNIIIVD